MFRGPGSTRFFQQPIGIAAHGLDGLHQAGAFGGRVLGNRVDVDQPGFVQVHDTLGHALAAATSVDADRTGAPGRADGKPLGPEERTRLGHLGDDHGDDLQPLDLVIAIVPGGGILDDDHADHFAKALDRHAQERSIAFLTGLGHVAEARRVLGIVGGNRLGAFGDPAHQTLTNAQPGRMHRVLTCRPSVAHSSRMRSSRFR